MSKTPVQIAVTYEQIGALKELADIANRVLAEAPADASYYSAFLDCEGVSHRLTLEQLRLLSSLPAALQSAAETPRATCELCGGTGMRGPEATQCPCGIPSPATNVRGRWRIIEAATARGYWGIELEDAGNDDDAIMYPIKIHPNTVARIVDAHNASLQNEGEQS